MGWWARAARERNLIIAAMGLDPKLLCWMRCREFNTQKRMDPRHCAQSVTDLSCPYTHTNRHTPAARRQMQVEANLFRSADFSSPEYGAVRSSALKARFQSYLPDLFGSLRRGRPTLKTSDGISRKPSTTCARVRRSRTSKRRP